MYAYENYFKLFQTISKATHLRIILNSIINQILNVKRKKSHLIKEIQMCESFSSQSLYRRLVNALCPLAIQFQIDARKMMG